MKKKIFEEGKIYKFSYKKYINDGFGIGSYNDTIPNKFNGILVDVDGMREDNWGTINFNGITKQVHRDWCKVVKNHDN